MILLLSVYNLFYSGTLSYIFNGFKGGRNFSDVVEEAKQKGYTEPDPRDDLSGMDVARKVYVLSSLPLLINAYYEMEVSFTLCDIT